MLRLAAAALAAACLAVPAPAQEALQAPADLPVIDTPASVAAPIGDWLLDPAPFVARVGRSADRRELILDNGLVRRTFRLAPNLACVGFDDLVRGETLIRAVRPEARITIDGDTRPIGGLVGQPNHAFRTPGWLDGLTSDPRALRLTGFEILPIEPRLAWQRVRHAAPDAVWPPRGVQLRFDFAPPARTSEQLAIELETASASGRGDDRSPGDAPPTDRARRRLWTADFATFDDLRVELGDGDPARGITHIDGAAVIDAPANAAAFVERDLDGATRVVEATFTIGSDDSASWGPGLALVFADRVVKLHLRPGGSAYDGRMQLGLWDGTTERVGIHGRVPLDRDADWTLRLRVTADHRVLADARSGAEPWRNYSAVDLGPDAGAPTAVRAGKLDQRGGATDFSTPGDEVRCTLLGLAGWSGLDPAALDRLAANDTAAPYRVAVHYGLYDGIPALSKWLEVHNDSDRTLTVDAFASEILAVVEHANHVETREGFPLPRPQHLHVETDFAFGGFTWHNTSAHVVHWRTDPQFSTQVNYLRQTPCLLEVSPTYGPSQDVAPGAIFSSYRTFELAHDSLDRERQSLALRRLYRTIAPWVTENPLMMHMRDSDPDRVRTAIDQCAAVGFEMLILSFGSGFDMENDDPAYLARWREVAAYARSRGIEIGGYSLLSSRRIGGGNDVVSPEGQRPKHGSCPALTSDWGQRYFEKLYAFFPETGFTLLEHDGPYPGDVDVTPRPPLQKGEPDSRWVQWRIASDFYAWCRGQGIYVNAPDHYYLNGTSKCGMGYREVNWSLPRDQQVIHTRQNIYDGTWTKTPSMGWMFVPLTEYHGGGAAATIEPLDRHLDHYDRMLTSNLALGVQACYRGPRLYDTERVRELVAARVAWFKRYRAILESDVVHGRRADGMDVDWMLHVNPQLDERGMLVVFNPLDEDVERDLPVDLHYTGLTGTATVAVQDRDPRTIRLDGRGRARIRVAVPARGVTWAVIRR